MSKVNFDINNFRTRMLDINENMESYEEDVKNVLKHFIESMPELKGIIDGTRTDETSDYRTKDEFYAGISKENDASNVTIDDLLEYIAENYNEKTLGDINADARISNEVGITKLFEDLTTKREILVEEVSKIAEDLLKDQEEAIKINEKAIKEEKETLRTLEEERETLKQIAIEIKAEEVELDTISGDEYEKKLSEFYKKQKQNEESLKANQEKIDMLVSDPDNSIAHHEKEQTDFKITLQRNRKRLLEIFKTNGIKLKTEFEQINTQTSNSETPQQVRRRAISVSAQQTQSQHQEEQNTIKQKSVVQLDDRERAKNMLKNLRHSSSFEQEQMLDGMGYGDISTMIENLGPINRRKFRTILKNRAEAFDISIEDLGNKEISDLFMDAKQIKKFIDEIETKTPKEIAAFEENLNKTKYGCLLYNAEKGKIKRKFREIFSKKDEQISNTEETLVYYYDRKSELNTKRFNFINQLRGKLGKSQLEQKPQPTRPTSKRKTLSDREDEISL